MRQKQAWIDKVMPPVERVRPDMWSIPVPMPNNPLRYVLVYVLAAPGGAVLVDAGWNTEEAWTALTAGLAAAGNHPAVPAPQRGGGDARAPARRAGARTGPAGRRRVADGLLDAGRVAAAHSSLDLRGEPGTVLFTYRAFGGTGRGSMVVSADSVNDVTGEVFAGTTFEHVRVQPDGDLLWIVLDRPGRLNAMTDRMKQEFLTVYERIEAGPWRCAVIAGEGRAFCSGADLGRISGVIDFTDAEQVRRYLDTGWQRVIELIHTVAVATVAAVHGAAYGGGANLALAADLVVAAETATFCQSYIDRGISPDLGGTVVLPRLVGLQHARRQLLLGEAVPAREALRIGMVCDVVPEAELRGRAREIAAALAAKDPTALGVTRRLIDSNLSRDLHSGLSHESLGVSTTLSSPIFKASTVRYQAPRSE